MQIVSSEKFFFPTAAWKPNLSRRNIIVSRSISQERYDQKRGNGANGVKYRCVSDAVYCIRLRREWLQPFTAFPPSLKTCPLGIRQQRSYFSGLLENSVADLMLASQYIFNKFLDDTNLFVH
jgi:hypothetical protein